MSLLKILLKENFNTEKESVSYKELPIGIEVEMEHTSDKEEAKKIALDHLKEDPNYYSKLNKAGLIDEPKAKQQFKT